MLLYLGFTGKTLRLTKTIIYETRKVVPTLPVALDEERHR